MARSTGSSRFGKFLNLIGLVDDQPDSGTGPASNQAEAAYPSRDSTARARDGYRSDGYRSGASASSAARRLDGAQQERASGYASGSRYSDDRSASAGRASQTPRTASRSGEDDEFWGDEAGRVQPIRRDSAPRPAADIRPANPARASNESGGYPPRHQTVIFRLQSFEECRDVILALLEQKSVLLILDKLDEPLVQRAIDTLGGAAFAIGATIGKASDRTYLIAPSNVVVADSDHDTAPRAARRYF